MWFLNLLGCVIAIVIDYVIAKKFEEIAEMKGHFGRTYFWFTFLFSVVGMLMVIALPEIEVEKTPKQSIIKPKDTAGAGEWKCTCGKIHKDYETSCVCGVTRAEAKIKNNQNN